MSSPEYLSRITKKMAAVLGGHYNDKEPIFLEDSMKIRTKKKYINLCLFALRFLAILVSISLIMAVIISLYKYDKGLKKTVIFVDTGCVSCDLLNSSAQSIEGVELKASTQTSIHQIVTESDFFDEGNVTEKDDITETRNETEIINLSGQAGVVSEKSHIPPASPPASSPSPPIHPPPLSPPASSPSSPIHLSPPASSPIHPPTPLSPPASSHSSSIHPPAHLSPPASSPIHPPSPANPPPPAPPLATPSTPPSPPATPSTPPPPPPPATPPPPPHSSLVEKESQSDYHENIKYSEYHKNYARPRSISTSSVYDTVMGYVRPVKDFVFGLVNRFLSLFSV